MPHYWSDQDDATPIRDGVRNYQQKTNSKHQPQKARKQYKKPKGIPTSPKPCTVHGKTEPDDRLIPLAYDTGNKVLRVAAKGVAETLPSRRKAHSAIWHTLEHFKLFGIHKIDGSDYHDDDFVVKDV